MPPDTRADGDKPSTSSRAFKIVTVSIVALSAGLAIPFLVVRKRNVNSTAVQAYSIAKNAAGSSPAAMLSRSSTIIRAPNEPLPSLMPPPPPLETPIPRSDTPKGNPFEHVGFAVKALGIATGLVVSITGITIITFRMATGIRTLPEFSHEMRSLIGTRFPTMRHRLYQGDPLEDDNVAQLPIDDAWTVEQAEARLQHAYDEGGWQGWASQAVVELNRELEWKRTRRA